MKISPSSKEESPSTPLEEKGSSLEKHPPLLRLLKKLLKKNSLQAAILSKEIFDKRF